MGERTIQDREEAIAWQKAMESSAPKVGETAPDFTLSDVQGTNQITLSALRGQRPVALIFGSFT